MRILIPSRGYGDYLAVTLPAWRALVPTAILTVVTDFDDSESFAVAQACEAVVVRTDAWTRDGAALNKARALDVAMGAREGAPWQPTEGTVCLVVDADVVPLGQMPPEAEIARDAIYGCARYRCESPEQLHAILAGMRGVEPSGLIQPRRRVPSHPLSAEQAAAMCLGYFQLFRYSARRGFGSYPTAGGYDHAFRAQFARRVGLTSIRVLHLGGQDRRNWSGRVLPRWDVASPPA